MREINIVTEFTVYTYDKVLQNYDAKARMYDPWNKRFMAQDIFEGSEENPQTLNRYPYVINNPKTYIDPTGLVYRSAQDLAGSIGGTATYITDDAGAGYRISLGGKSYDYYEGTAYVWSFWQNDVFYLDDEGFYSHWGFSEIDRGISQYKLNWNGEVEAEAEASMVIAANTYKIPEGPPNSSEPIYDKKGNKVGERFYGPDGKATHDRDDTDHGNPVNHPNVPHEHIWGPERREDGTPVPVVAVPPQKQPTPAQNYSLPELPNITLPEVCFAGDTLIKTEQGLVPIIDIKIGDYVYSCNPETGEQGYKKVVELFSSESNEMV
jgi:RHS repeat-associated protein